MTDQYLGSDGVLVLPDKGAQEPARPGTVRFYARGGKFRTMDSVGVETILDGDLLLTSEQSGTLKHIKFNPTTDTLETDRDVATPLGSLFLSAQHKISSSGENVFFTNMSEKVNYFPMWSGIKDQTIIGNQDATGLIPAFARVYSDEFKELAPIGPEAAIGSVPFETSINAIASLAAFALEVRVEEVIAPGQWIAMRVWSDDGLPRIKIFETLTTNIEKSVGEILEIQASPPVDFVKGRALFLEISIGDEREGPWIPLKVRPADGAPTEPWRNLKFRSFVDEPLALKKYVHKMLLGQELSDLFTDEVEFHANLPLASTVNGQIYRVMKRTANYWSLGMASRFLAGYYESDGTNWVLRPNAAIPTFDLAQGDTALTTNYRNFTPADIASIAGPLDRIVSPNQTWKAKVSNTDFLVNDGTRDRLFTNNTKSLITSSDGKNYFEVRNASARINQNGKKRLWMDSSSTELKSPDVACLIEIFNTKFNVTHSSVIRSQVNATSTWIKSPDTFHNIKVDNTGAFYDDSKILTSNDAGVTIPSLVAGVIPEAQLPSFVDDVIEGFLDTGNTKANVFESFYLEATLDTLIAAEVSKIYIDRNFNTSYRFTGSGYAQISSGLVLGELGTNAYRGDRGKIAFDHSQEPHDFAATAHVHNAIQSPDILNTLIANDSGLLYLVNGTIRIQADATSTILSSPNVLESLAVNNTGAFYNGIEIATVDDVTAIGGGLEITAPDPDAIAFWDTSSAKLVTHPNATIDSNGDITANKFIGDGSLLTNLPGGDGSGDVVGPTSSIDFRVPTFDGATGKLLQQSNVSVSVTGSMTGINQLTANSALITGTLVAGGPAPGAVGGFAGGDIQIKVDGTSANSSAAITGHNRFGGNTQLWYFGSSSGGNQDVTLLNRQTATLHLGTNNMNTVHILSNGNINHDNFTAMGSGNTQIKIKILSGITSSVEGGVVSPAHGLIRDNIVGVSVIIHGAIGVVHQGHTAINSESEFQWELDSSLINIRLNSSQSLQLRSVPYYVMLTYIA